MTNTKPTWEEEFDKNFSEFNSPTRFQIKTFIKKVEEAARQEAYERGKNDKKCCEGCFEHV